MERSIPAHQTPQRLEQEAELFGMAVPLHQTPERLGPEEAESLQLFVPLQETPPTVSLMEEQDTANLNIVCEDGVIIASSSQENALNRSLKASDNFSTAKD